MSGATAADALLFCYVEYNPCLGRTRPTHTANTKVLHDAVWVVVTQAPLLPMSQKQCHAVV